MKGFYPAGGGELAEAIETAIKINTPGVVMVPISNWAAFGGSKETIIWMPIETIAATITQLVAVRKQTIDDIYQITGLSDIMRGATDARETLGAQQLKTQFGSTPHSRQAAGAGADRARSGDDHQRDHHREVRARRR